MPNAISNDGLSPIRPPGVRPGAAAAADAAGDDFASLVRQQLERVSALQTEADDNVARLMSGEGENMTEVFVAARKAQVAFSLLMEIRNKLIDAYEELKNMRV